METIDSFMEQILHEIPQLKKSYEDELNYWLPDKPPLTLLMSNLGREIINLRLDDETIKKFMVNVEDGMNSNNEKLSNALATGLLETIFFNLSVESQDKFKNLLGENSKKHINNLGEFY